MLSLVKRFNFILAADAYKGGHWLEIDPETEYTWSVIVPRKVSAFSPMIVAIGQAFIAHVLSTVRITQEDIEEAAIEITEQGYLFNREGWEIIVREFDGRIPLAFYAVEEGRVVAPQTPIAGLVNTDPRFAWLPPYVETWTQDVMWLMSSTATVCRAAREIMKRKMEETGSDMSMLDYKVHNFGDRAAGSPEEGAVLTGIAHAALFNGSDCMRANGYIKKLYGTNKAYTSSVEAFEHSTVCANSNAETKDDWMAAVKAVDRLEAVVELAKQGIGIPVVSVVIDTYDDERFVDEYLGVRLHDRIVNSGGQLVGRPDSGDPKVRPGVIGRLFANRFGSTKNSLGYESLAPCVAVLQGDGINILSMEPVADGWIAQGFNLDGFLVGMGTGTTNFCDRDTFSFSMKAVASKRKECNWRKLLKEPKTDLGKKSLTGLVRCRENANGELEVFDALDEGVWKFEESTPGWRCFSSNGYRQFRQSFDDVRDRAREGLTV